MTREAQTGPWAVSGYGGIGGVEAIGDQIDVAFVNGDVVRLSPRQLGVRLAFEANNVKGAGDLAITVVGTERTITWSQRRAAAADPGNSLTVH